MSMFQDPNDEERLCQVLRAFVQEWGAEAVVVSVPKHWKEYGGSSLGRVRLEFTTVATVSIRAEYECGRISYDVQLRTGLQS